MSLEITVDGELQLKQYSPEDAQPAFDLIDRNRSHLSNHGEPTGNKYPTKESFLESITHPKNPDKLRFGIWDRDTLVGSINLIQFNSVAEIGYYLGKEFTGRQYTVRATKALVQYAFANGFDMVFAKVHEENVASRRVLEKLTSSGYLLGKQKANSCMPDLALMRLTD